MDLHERAARANESAAAKFDEAARAEDAARAEELLAQGTKLAEESKRFADAAAEADKLRAARERDAARQLSATPERADVAAREDMAARATRYELPSEDELAERSRMIEKSIVAGGIAELSERDAMVATREFAVEELFFDALRSRFATLKGGDPTLTGEKRKAWRSYVERARAVQQRLTSPLTGGQLAGTAGSGAEFVPEAWSADVIYNMAFYGPLADPGRVRMFSNDTVGTYHVATVTDNETKRARILAEATASTKDRVTTSEVTLNPRNTAVQIPFTDQMLMGGNINLRGFIERDVPEWFGRSMNGWYWSGSGTNQPSGINTIAKTNANRYQIATTKVVTEGDVTRFVGLLDKAYGDLPQSTIMMHWGTILYLMTIRSGTGERVFPLTPDRKSIVLPGGVTVEANNAITLLGTGAQAATTDIVAFYGDLMCYGAIMLGGMNVEMQRNLESFQWLLSWNFFQDAAPLNQQAFAFLQGR